MKVSREAGRALLGSLGVAVLAVFTYRPLLRSSLGDAVKLDLESWFFEPESKTTMLVLGLAAWLLWRRRNRLAELPMRSDTAMAAVLLVLGAGLFIWAQLTRSADILLPSLASNLLALACLTRGRAGCRVVLLPALVLLFPLLLPVPIRDELVWRLQLWTAGGATWIMQLVGYEVSLTGVLIHGPVHTFFVIESCSGMRGIEILFLVSVVIRELFAESGGRQWLLLAVVPWLGFGLNLVRIFVVAAMAMAGPKVPGPFVRDHSIQGVAVLILGTGVLYAMGLLMAGGKVGRGASSTSPGSRTDQRAKRLVPRFAVAWLVSLAILSVALPPFPTQASPDVSTLDIPESHAGWTSSPLTAYGPFVGALPREQIFFRRYEKKRGNRPGHVVELFVGLEAVGNRETDRLFTTKLATRNADWTIEDIEPVRLWSLQRDGDIVTASRETELTLSYVWLIRDEGIWRESIRALLALEQSPFRRARPRVAVRLRTAFPFGSQLSRDRAKQTLDGFIVNFRAELAGL